MSVLNWDRVWTRLKKLPDFKNKEQWQFRPWIRSYQFAITTGGVSGPASVEFPAGAIILGTGAGVSVASQAATTLIQGLNAFRIQIEYTGSDGSIISTATNGVAIWGVNGDRQFPPREIIMPSSASLNVTVTNLTTSTIAVDIAFHTMVFRMGAA